ncbi:hypothetical protein AB0F52_14710 [Amycolatopsis sp. NPDC024027]|uniref:hypothetical protein n=1 Tax=Amycolatopsis sp. NPDC024027 TaxID=3154327 RepID=UPI0033CA934B
MGAVRTLPAAMMIAELDLAPVNCITAYTATDTWLNQRPIATHRQSNAKKRPDNGVCNGVVAARGIDTLILLDQV